MENRGGPVCLLRAARSSVWHGHRQTSAPDSATDRPHRAKKMQDATWSQVEATSPSTSSGQAAPAPSGQVTRGGMSFTAFGVKPQAMTISATAPSHPAKVSSLDAANYGLFQAASGGRVTRPPSAPAGMSLWMGTQCEHREGEGER